MTKSIERPAAGAAMREAVMPAYQKIASAIEQSIVTGRLRPGDPVGTEAELVEQFGVNRSTVREGIRLLERSGLIRRESGRRLFACLPACRDVSGRMSHALLIHGASFREVWEATHALETASVEYAALRATPEDVALLRENVDRTMNETDPDALCSLDMQFHGLIANASRNRALQLSRDAVTNLCFSSVTLILGKVKPAAARLREAHTRIFQAIESRDPELARMWMRRHTNDWLKGYGKAGRDIEAPVNREEAGQILSPHPAAPVRRRRAA